MNKYFKDSLPEKTDEELIKIVTVDRESYQSMALTDAEEEIKRRNISSSKIEAIKADLMLTLEEERHLNIRSVGVSMRIVHVIVDTFAILILYMPLFYMLGYFASWANLELSMLAVYLVLAIGFFGYYVFMETKYQKTIGKFITKTSVTMKDGGKPKAEDIIRRTFYRLIPLDMISFLYSGNGLHDKLSNTTITKDEI